MLSGHHGENPDWYKDAIIYELHIKSFFDSNNDGIGDIKGLTKKLDYLEQLGVTAIWLLPFYPSPLRDDGYDISDYFSVNPEYGNLRDIKALLREAHKRDIRIITELVLNHTSDQHNWFQKSRSSKPGSEWRDYYVWNDSTDKYSDARIIFKDFESSNWSWDPVARSYYWHRFYSHQPDLNFTNPKVQKAMIQVIDFWFNLGVDGLRLDAVPYLFEEEGTNCENLPATHQYLKELRKYVDNNYTEKMFLAEANQWPEDAVAYFGNGDECHMAYHFPLMPRMFMAIQMENNVPIIDILDQTPDIPSTCQWALFLRNHDELTLEMVTDEERDYMYRMYAKETKAKINMGIRRRLAPLLENDRRKIELLNMMLFSFPGTPVIYYGDEIGMGDNFYLGDRDGVRVPMQWSPDRNAGFSQVNPHKLFLPIIIDPEYHYEAINVENQERNISSLLWWMKKVIALRKEYKAFGRGHFKIIQSHNTKVLTFLREYNDEKILVVFNLSRYPQAVEINLSRFMGYSVIELFSQNKFPDIQSQQYMLTLGPYNYYWFELKEKESSHEEIAPSEYPVVTIPKSLMPLFSKSFIDSICSRVFPKYLKKCSWFSGKDRRIQTVKAKHVIPVKTDLTTMYMVILHVLYNEGDSDHFILPVSAALGDAVTPIYLQYPKSIIIHIKINDSVGVLYDCLYHEQFQKFLMNLIQKNKKIKIPTGHLIAHRGKRLAREGESAYDSKETLLKEMQNNTVIISGEVLSLKLYRKTQPGLHPEIELNTLLSEKNNFSGIPEYLGSIEFKSDNNNTYSIGLLQKYVKNENNGMTYVEDNIHRYFDNVLVKKLTKNDIVHVMPSFINVGKKNIPVFMQELIDTHFIEMIHLMGIRTAELHIALSKHNSLPEFAMEPFSKLYQRSLYQSIRSQVKQVFTTLNKKMFKVPFTMISEAKRLISHESLIFTYLKKISEKNIKARKIRIHGDYRLDQLLFTGKDFVILDLEGESHRYLSERRLKYSPLRDVASMIRSFHNVLYNTFMQFTKVRKQDTQVIEPFMEPWFNYISGIFLNGYLDIMKDSELIPQDKGDLETLIVSFIMERHISDLGLQVSGEMDESIVIPLKGISRLINEYEER
jgi:maltose alpha-D-glucosyltransferase/alpha-amylase